MRLLLSFLILFTICVTSTAQDIEGMKMEIDNGSMENMHMHMMQMTFYWDIEVIYLFKEWHVKTWGWYIFALVVTFIACIVIEGLNFLRYYL